MIDKSHSSLSVGAQYRLLSIARSSFDYELMGEAAMNLDLMAVYLEGVRWAYAALLGPRSHLTLADIEHAGSRLLRRGFERGDPQVRPARDHEHRSGVTVHIIRLDGLAEKGRHPYLNGRQRALHRQQLL